MTDEECNQIVIANSENFAPLGSAHGFNVKPVSISSNIATIFFPRSKLAANIGISKGVNTVRKNNNGDGQNYYKI